jgi:beta-lactamase regulating signal transducer with metallopeptidase domain
MGAELLQSLATSTIVSTVAILLVKVLRKPARFLAGAQAAYWLWLLVPMTTITVLVPGPSQVALPAAVEIPIQIQSTWLSPPSGDISVRTAWINAILAIWVAGLTAVLAAMAVHQRRFARTIGSLVADARGFFRSEAISSPMLVGVWHSRILVPADFEAIYSVAEQELVLAHEYAHRRRMDVAINALASLALCVFWFNPLMYWALVWIRGDQELACDAEVLSDRADARRVYADMLLKTQLAAESAWLVPVGCHWQSSHPLKERILMLKRPLPGISRRLAGVSLALCLTSAAAFGVWAGQPASQIKGPSILVDLKLTVTNPQSSEMNVYATRYIVHSGEEIADSRGRPLDFACTPYLPDESGRSTDWRSMQSRGLPIPPVGHILLTCAIRQDGKEISSPAVMIADGKWGTIETSEQGGPRRYKLELSASTSAATIAEAAKSVKKS